MAVKIYQRDTRAPGEPYRLLQPGVDVIIEIDNSDGQSLNAQIRFADVTQTDPAGRFRVTVSDTNFRIEAPTLAGWLDSKTLLEFDANGVSKILFSEDGLSHFLRTLLLQLHGKGQNGIYLRQLLKQGELAT